MSLASESETVFLHDLGQNVRTARGRRGMSRKVLSQASGVSERYIAQLESGQGNVSIVLLRRVAAAIGARIEDLLPSAETNPHWPVLRDLLRNADAAQVATIRRLLAGEPSRKDEPRRSRIALIGLRGAGKSTLGRRLADRLGWSFVELNRDIETQAGLSVAEIMALYGQEGYRRLEQAALRRIIARPDPVVLATGGGIVSEPVTFDLVLAAFFTVWIKARPEDHMARVRQQGDLRPMADDRSAMQELRTILAAREPLYAQADASLDTAGLSIEAAADSLFDTVQPQLVGLPA